MIAIIDRDRLTAFGLALLLRDWGYETVAGTTAGEIFGRAEARGAPIAAIVADDRGEDGSTGGDEAAALAALARRAIPTVVLGGDDAEMPGMAQIPKPFEPIRLRDLLETMVRIDR
jgi:electron transfer flavoprotein alpha/beta subunit